MWLADLRRDAPDLAGVDERAEEIIELIGAVAGTTFGFSWGAVHTVP